MKRARVHDALALSMIESKIYASRHCNQSIENTAASRSSVREETDRCI
jgi:hypothetical protein